MNVMVYDPVESEAVKYQVQDVLRGCSTGYPGEVTKVVSYTFMVTLVSHGSVNIEHKKEHFQQL